MVPPSLLEECSGWDGKRWRREPRDRCQALEEPARAPGRIAPASGAREWVYVHCIARLVSLAGERRMTGTAAVARLRTSGRTQAARPAKARCIAGQPRAPRAPGKPAGSP